MLVAPVAAVDHRHARVSAASRAAPSWGAGSRSRRSSDSTIRIVSARLSPFAERGLFASANPRRPRPAGASPTRTRAGSGSRARRTASRGSSPASRGPTSPSKYDAASSRLEQVRPSRNRRPRPRCARENRAPGTWADRPPQRGRTERPCSDPESRRTGCVRTPPCADPRGSARSIRAPARRPADGRRPCSSAPRPPARPAAAAARAPGGGPRPRRLQDVLGPREPRDARPRDPRRAAPPHGRPSAVPVLVYVGDRKAVDGTVSFAPWHSRADDAHLSRARATTTVSGPRDGRRRRGRRPRVKHRSAPTSKWDTARSTGGAGHPRLRAYRNDAASPAPTAPAAGRPGLAVRRGRGRPPPASQDSSLAIVVGSSGRRAARAPDDAARRRSHPARWRVDGLPGLHAQGEGSGDRGR